MREREKKRRKQIEEETLTGGGGGGKGLCAVRRDGPRRPPADGRSARGPRPRYHRRRRRRALFRRRRAHRYPRRAAVFRSPVVTDCTRGVDTRVLVRRRRRRRLRRGRRRRRRVVCVCVCFFFFYINFYFFFNVAFLIFSCRRPVCPATTNYRLRRPRRYGNSQPLSFTIFIIIYRRVNYCNKHYRAVVKSSILF